MQIYEEFPNYTNLRNAFLYNCTKKPPRREADLRRDLLPEVGSGLHDETFFHPTTDDGLHHRRLIVGQTDFVFVLSVTWLQV